MWRQFFLSLFMLICRKICFVAIYAVLAQNLFCRDLRAFVWRKIYWEIVLVEKKDKYEVCVDLERPLPSKTSTKQQGQIPPFQPVTSSLLFLLWADKKCHLLRWNIVWPISMQLWVKSAFIIMVGSKLCITIMSHFYFWEAPWTKILKNRYE